MISCILRPWLAGSLGRSRAHFENYEAVRFFRRRAVNVFVSITRMTRRARDGRWRRSFVVLPCNQRSGLTARPGTGNVAPTSGNSGQQPRPDGRPSILRGRPTMDDLLSEWSDRRARKTTVVAGVYIQQGSSNRRAAMNSNDIGFDAHCLCSIISGHGGLSCHRSGILERQRSTNHCSCIRLLYCLPGRLFHRWFNECRVLITIIEVFRLHSKKSVLA